ncbi:hypothetical protein [Pedobacter frigiditerrae]|uniref:hypothetical protein n=1 Tax=Pedobacter frigiditerrae TaxID=2530452 RepID=UPI00292FBFD0|nr:hypothetical protein [Pedobacter frigiditerrae]
MANQLTSNAEALRLFFTEDVYLVKDDSQNAFIEPVTLKADLSSAIPTIERIVTQETPSLPIVEEPKPKMQKEWDFEFLGKNQKGILILVNDAANKVSSPQGTELLRKLVKAIELTNNDFALVNYANYLDATFDDLNRVFSCQLLISFGVGAKTLGLGEQALHQMSKAEQTRMIFTSNLHDLDADQASKKLLWATLQQLK